MLVDIVDTTWHNHYKNCVNGKKSYKKINQIIKYSKL